MTFQSFAPFLRGPVSNLQDTNKRIHQIVHYVCGQVEWLATDRRTLYCLIHQIAHDMGQLQGECDACEQGGGSSACIDITVPERDEDTIPDCTFLMVRMTWMFLILCAKGYEI